MKTMIFIAMMLAATLSQAGQKHSSETLCNTINEFASAVMEAKHTCVRKSDMMSSAGHLPGAVLMIKEAYSTKTDVNRPKQIKEFGDKWQLICLTEGV